MSNSDRNNENGYFSALPQDDWSPGDPLKNDRYHLHEFEAAFDLDGFRIHVDTTDKGLIVDLYDAQRVIEDDDYDDSHLGVLTVAYAERSDPGSRGEPQTPEDFDGSVGKPLDAGLYFLHESGATLEVDAFRITLEGGDQGVRIAVYDSQSMEGCEKDVPPIRSLYVPCPSPGISSPLYAEGPRLTNEPDALDASLTPPPAANTLAPT